MKTFIDGLEANLDDSFQQAMILSLSQVIPRSLIRSDCQRQPQGGEKYFSVGSEEHVEKFLVKLRKHIHKDLYGLRPPERNDFLEQTERPTGFTILSSGRSKVPRFELKSSDEGSLRAESGNPLP